MTLDGLVKKKGNTCQRRIQRSAYFLNNRRISLHDFCSGSGFNCVTILSLKITLPGPDDVITSHPGSFLLPLIGVDEARVANLQEGEALFGHCEKILKHYNHLASYFCSVSGSSHVKGMTVRNEILP